MMARCMSFCEDMRLDRPFFYAIANANRDGKNIESLFSGRFAVPA